MYDYYLDWEKYQEISPVYEQLFEIEQSDAAYNKYNSAIGLGDLLEKPEGEDLKADAPLEGYTIICKNRTFGRMVRFTMEQVQDNQKFPDFMRTVVGSWKNSLERTKDRFYVKFFNKGALTAGHDVFNNTITGVVDDSTGDLIYDGYPFFDETHPDKVGNTYANWVQTRALNPDNLETSWNTFTQTNNRDERGNEIELVPNCILYHPALNFTAKRILQSTNIPGSADNDVNVLQGIVTPIMWQRISGTDDWFLGVKGMGLMGTDRMAPEMDFYQDVKTSLYIVIYKANPVNSWEALTDNAEGNHELSFEDLILQRKCNDYSVKEVHSSEWKRRASYNKDDDIVSSIQKCIAALSGLGIALPSEDICSTKMKPAKIFTRPSYTDLVAVLQTGDFNQKFPYIVIYSKKSGELFWEALTDNAEGNQQPSSLNLQFCVSEKVQRLTAEDVEPIKQTRVPDPYFG